jgi:hypothetical protein
MTSTSNKKTGCWRKGLLFGATVFKKPNLAQTTSFFTRGLHHHVVRFCLEGRKLVA